MSTRKQGKGFWLGALAGGVAGSIAALLLTPKTGKEMRHDISVGAHKVGDVTVKVASQVGETASDMAEKAKQMGSKVASTVKSWRGAGTEEELAAVSSHHSRQEELELAFSDLELFGEGKDETDSDPARS
ncbi:YtxH domain-containing protein [Paenibacillus protaetiae]|uniref:YtxH domain-containing protein n=1 Tax=Paenibacillus protaetiae TaxID=2509456 RepID=A0A4P6EU27_9BACL|nr:YtxH domain-containing protein [Paenibacillus protaetiae]QAY66442.1 YtxH domain-containing protein [Paenibacillus protaetiae]